MPSAWSASAARMPRSDVVTITARAPGATPYKLASRRAPPEIITPGRSLPANTSGCSIAPVAKRWWRARIWCSVSPCQTATRPSKCPSAGAQDSTSTPASSARAVSSRACSCPPSHSSRPPGSGPSSTSTTSAPRSAAAIAPANPATPPPTTSRSACRRRYSVLQVRSPWVSGSRPRPAEHPLVRRPEPPRPDERLVVEAGRRERATDRVGERHRVDLEPRARVEVLDLRSIAHGLGAGAYARRAVDRDQAVGAVARAAHQAAPAVVLEAAREGALAGGVERRADRVACERRHLPAVEGERDALIAVDQLRRLGSQAGHELSSPGSPTRKTSFVRVSLSAWNHVRQPER
jgi:hypothetical protein